MSRSAHASEPISAKKTLAIRLEASQHRQVWVLAQVEGLTVTDAIREAIDEWIGNRCSRPGAAERAASVLDAAERETVARRRAMADLLGRRDEGETKE